MYCFAYLGCHKLCCLSPSAVDVRRNTNYAYIQFTIFVTGLFGGGLRDDKYFCLLCLSVLIAGSTEPDSSDNQNKRPTPTRN